MPLYTCSKKCKLPFKFKALDHSFIEHSNQKGVCEQMIAVKSRTEEEKLRQYPI